MRDDEHNEEAENNLIRRIRERLANADKGREPEFVTGRMGTRMMSFAALFERVIVEFINEHSTDSQALQEADTEAKRLSLVLATTDYVLAVESIHLDAEKKAELIRSAYAHLFSFGPLDSLFANPDITTISLKGADSASVRYGHVDLTSIDPLFESETHLRQIIQRMAQAANINLDSDTPIIEFGLSIADKRPASISVVMPPATYEMTVDIRLHPHHAPGLGNLSSDYQIPPDIMRLLQAVIQSPHGTIIVGDAESGKTTLLSAIARSLQNPDLIAVERAGELRLPEQATSFTVTWSGGEEPAVSFGNRIGEALKRSPQIMLLDEVRADEAEAIAPILQGDATPRQIWAFRGPANSKRLAAALGMLARRSNTAAGESIVQALYRKLPFVIVLRRTKGEIRLHTIAEWQFRGDAEYPDFVELTQQSFDGLKLADNRSLLPLNLPETFWNEPR